MIEVEGEILTQSNTMLRYAGKIAKLYPEDPFEAAKVDEFLDLIEDILPKFYQAVFESDQEKRKQLIQFVNQYFFLFFQQLFFFFYNFQKIFPSIPKNFHLFKIFNLSFSSFDSN